MKNKNKKKWWVKSTVCVTLNYIEYLLVLMSACDYWMCLEFCFASLVGIYVGIASSSVGIQICTRTGGIKKYKSITK